MLDTSKEEIKKGFFGLFSQNYENKDKNTITSYNKKGSDIKLGFLNILSQINKQKSICLDSMNLLLDKITFAPNQACEETEDYVHLIDYLPKRFSYFLINNGEDSIKKDNGIEQTIIKIPTDEEKAYMREYNILVHEYIELSIYKLKLESSKRNIEDSKNYQLSINQLAILGL